MQDKESRVDLEVIAEPSDVNSAYLEVLHNLKVRKPVIKPQQSGTTEEIQKAKDYYASIRKSTFWSNENCLLIYNRKEQMYF